jgi:hypothetical protein
MWKKAWWECRTRVGLAAAIGVLYGLDGVWTRGGLNWESYCQLMSGVVVPVVALLLAGSGINSQTSWGMTNGFHPSMYFLLSMPVSRRRALLVRAALGAGLLLLFIGLLVCGVGQVAQWRGSDIRPAQIASSAVFTAVGAWAIFGAATFLTTFLDELWAGVIGFLIAGGLCGAGWAMRNLNTTFQPLDFLTGALWYRQGQVNWHMLAWFVGIGIAFLWAAVWVVEKKEY